MDKNNGDNENQVAGGYITANLTPPRFCLVITAQDGTQLVKLFETDSGLLDVEWSDPPRHSESAHRFIEGVIQIWNSLR